MSPLHLLCVLFIVAASVKQARAVTYQVVDNTGNITGCNRFQTEIGLFYTKQTLKAASSFIWLTFNESQSERKDYDQVTLIVQSLRPAPPAIIAMAINNTIVINSDYIQNYSGDVRVEFTGILYHEGTHVWQWNGNRKAPAGLINGVADYVRLKAGLAPKEWPKKGSGTVWDEGYAVTAYFLEYCEGLKGGFLAELNGLMKNDYSDDYFHTLLGETVDELWSDYKSQFGN